MDSPNFPPIPTPWDDAAKATARQLLQSEVYGSWSVPTPYAIQDRKALRPGRELLFTPFPILCATPQAPGPWPLLLGLNFYGLHSLELDENLPSPPTPATSITSDPSEPSTRGSHSAAWPLNRITQAGWAVATAYVGDLEPDQVALSKGEAISKWAQGIVRLRHTLALDPRFDVQRMVALGHSRLGKTALWANAMDPGLSGVIALQSGCGGAAPSRTNLGETVKDITTTFPHWFTPRFASYAENPDELPLDQHWLLALCADRPTLLCNASEDAWANPEGQHDLLRLAAAANGQTISDLQIGKTVGNKTAHFFRTGQHEVNSTDWDAILLWLATHFEPAHRD